MSRKEEIEIELQKELAPFFLEVRDESFKHQGHKGVEAQIETHFFIRIGSLQFDKKTLLESHRLVNQILFPFFSQGLHALRLEIYPLENSFDRSRIG